MFLKPIHHFATAVCGCIALQKLLVLKEKKKNLILAYFLLQDSGKARPLSRKVWCNWATWLISRNWQRLDSLLFRWLVLMFSICTTQFYCLKMCKCCDSSKAKHSKSPESFKGVLQNSALVIEVVCIHIFWILKYVYVFANVKIAVNILNSHLNTRSGAWASFLSYLCPVSYGFSREGTEKGTDCTSHGLYDWSSLERCSWKSDFYQLIFIPESYS